MSKKASIIKLSKKLKKEDEELDESDIDETDKIDDDVEFNDDSDNVDEEEEDNEIDIENNNDEDNKLCDINNEYYDDDNEIEAQPDINIVYINKEERQSLAKLTKYEMVRILGERTKQLTMGAKPLIKNYKGLNYDKIAEEEFKLNMIPFKIRRPLPNGKYELWNLEELSKEHLLYLLE